MVPLLCGYFSKAAQGGLVGQQCSGWAGYVVGVLPRAFPAQHRCPGVPAGLLKGLCSSAAQCQGNLVLMPVALASEDLSTEETGLPLESLPRAAMGAPQEIPQEVGARAQRVWEGRLLASLCQELTEGHLEEDQEWRVRRPPELLEEGKLSPATPLPVPLCSLQAGQGCWQVMVLRCE